MKKIFLGLFFIFLIISFFLYDISGRGKAPDFVRPLLIFLLLFFSSFIFFKLKYKKLSYIVLFLENLVLASISLAYFYYQRFDSFVTGDDVIAFFQTDTKEALGYVISYVLTLKAVLVTITLVLINNLFLWLFFNLLNKKESKIIAVRKKIIFIFIAVIFVVASIVLVFELRPIKLYRIMKVEYYQQLEQFNAFSKALNDDSNNLVAVKKNKDPNKGEVYVLVIGESLARSYMGCYQSFLNTTPFLSDSIVNNKAILFENSYSSFVTTQPALTAALSEGTIKKGIIFPKGNFLFNVTKKANVKTYWISNQVKLSKFDTAVAAIADKADYSYFTVTSSDGSQSGALFDEKLIPELSKIVNNIKEEENSLIVIQLMGSHLPYDRRYPNKFDIYKFKDPLIIGKSENNATIYNEYLNSVLYNDFIIEKIYEEVSSHSNFAGLVYFSDHAEDSFDTDLGHNPSAFTFDMTKIPVIVFLSDLYKKAYPDSYENLVNNKSKYFTNDSIYDFILSLMQVESPAIDYSNSMVSKDYKKTLLDVELLNNHKLTDFPEALVKEELLKNSSNVYALKVNSVFKLFYLYDLGFRNFVIDPVFCDYKQLLEKILKFYESSEQKFEPIKIIVQNKGVNIAEGQTEVRGKVTIEEYKDLFFKQNSSSPYNFAYDIYFDNKVVTGFDLETEYDAN